MSISNVLETKNESRSYLQRVRSVEVKGSILIVEFLNGDKLELAVTAAKINGKKTDFPGGLNTEDSLDLDG